MNKKRATRAAYKSASLVAEMIKDIYLTDNLSYYSIACALDQSLDWVYEFKEVIPDLYGLWIRLKHPLIKEIEELGPYCNFEEIKGIIFNKILEVLELSKSGSKGLEVLINEYLYES